MHLTTLIAEQTESCIMRQLKWAYMVIMQACQIISGPGINKTADKIETEVFMRKMHNEFSDVFFRHRQV